MATKEEVVKVIETMAHMPNTPLRGTSKDDKILHDFYLSLKDVDIETLFAAVIQYKREEKFFPTSSGILDKVFDLQMIASGFPTPTEAWGMVLEGKKNLRAVYCEIATQLGGELEKAIGPDYWRLHRIYSDHRDTCAECANPSENEHYNHPVVSEVVRLLGGRNAILTDNPMADRARFIDGFKEIMGREKKKLIMHPETKVFIERKQESLVSGEVKKLSEGMKK